MSWIMDGNNFNQRGLVHNPQEDLCRTIIGGVDAVDIMLETNRKCLSGDPVYLGRLIPDSGKLHQNQEVWDAWGGVLHLESKSL